jgi:group I intron endonuclease
MFTVYLIHNMVNGKVYVGQTYKSVHQRWKEHIQSAQSTPTYYFRKAILKHGPENFKIKELNRVETKQEANRIETYWIAFFQSHCPENGYNLTLGGEGIIPNEATRRKQSEAKLGNKHPFYGKHCSEEHKQKIANANRKSKIEIPIAELKALHEQGLSVRQLAEKFEASPDTITTRLKKVGVKMHSSKLSVEQIIERFASEKEVKRMSAARKKKWLERVENGKNEQKVAPQAMH